MSSYTGGLFYDGTTNNQQWDENSSISFEDILEIQSELEEFKYKQEESFQNIFKALFGGDYRRGDIVVFTSKQEASYNMFKERLPEQILTQVKIDRSGVLEQPVVLRG